jgi:hypothetical protein
MQPVKIGTLISIEERSGILQAERITAKVKDSEEEVEPLEGDQEERQEIKSECVVRHNK